ncbi:MAG: hypothetical protein ACFWT0_06785 [Bifidobacterium crudilactis]
MVMSATCKRPGASVVNCLFTRSGLPPVPLAGRVVIGFRPRRTPWIVRERMTCSTWSRPIPRHPRRISRRWTFRYPYTAMNRCAWITMMSRAGVS